MDVFRRLYVCVKCGILLVGGYHKMHLVDSITCVICGQKEYALSRGKSARAQSGVCDGCKGGMSYARTASSTSTSDGSPSQQTSIPEGRARSKA